MKSTSDILVLFESTKDGCPENYEGVFSTEKEIEKYLKNEHRGENPIIDFQQSSKNEFKLFKNQPDICDISVMCKDYSANYYYLKETLNRKNKEK